MGNDDSTPTGWARGLKLLSLASQLGAKEFANRVGLGDTVATRIDQARILAQSLKDLKGAAMKAGQLLSLDVGDLLPPEATELLSQLQGQATALPFSTIDDILTKELGPERRSKLRLEPEAIAAASIGQVHRGVVSNLNSVSVGGSNGETKVAVKVQYPGVRASIDNDLALIRRLGETFLKLNGKEIPLDGIFSDLRQVLLEETDFTKEAGHMARYSNLFLNDKDYVVPTPMTEYLTPSVLVMSWLEGTPIRNWIRSNPSKPERARMAHLVLDLFCIEFSRNGFVQTDPNFANFLVTTDQKLGLVDFGSSMHYTPEFRVYYGNLLRTFQTGTADQVFTRAVEFGLLDPRENREVQLAFKDLIQTSLRPFAEERQPFDFRDKDFEKQTLEANIRFSRLLKYSPPPRPILFLHRKLGGVFNLVKSMNVSLDLRPYWQKMTL
jgi:aarF domain-containing kinase